MTQQLIRDSVDAVLVGDLEPGSPPGSFKYYVSEPGGPIAGMRMILPGGLLSSITFGQGRWTWDGNRERPTVSPSIDCKDHAQRWHGFLRAGRFESC